jgi:hypothetical protein
MPTRRRRPSVRIAPESGRKNPARRGRRSSVRWRSGWLSSRHASRNSRFSLVIRAPGDAGRAGWRESSRSRRHREPIAPSLRRFLPNHPSLAGDGDAAEEVVAARNRRSRRTRSWRTALRSNLAPFDRDNAGGRDRDGEIRSAAAPPARRMQHHGETARRHRLRRRPRDRRGAMAKEGSAAGVDAAAEAVAADRNPAADRIHRAGRAAHHRRPHQQAELAAG